jgi:outer membrane protein
MKLSYVSMLTIVAALGSSTVALSQGAAATTAATTAASSPKIATIAFNATVSQTNEFQRDFNEVQKKFAPKESELKTLGDEVDSLKKQLQASGDKLSEEEKANRVKAIDTKEKQLQRNAEDAQNDFQGESGQAFQKVAEKVFNFLQDYSKQNGYTLVVDRGNAQAPIVWYADPTNDISQAVVTAYNTKSGVAAQPGANAPNAPRPQAAKPAAPKPAAPAAAKPAAPGTPKQ